MKSKYSPSDIRLRPAMEAPFRGSGSTSGWSGGSASPESWFEREMDESGGLCITGLNQEAMGWEWKTIQDKDRFYIYRYSGPDTIVFPSHIEGFPVTSVRGTLYKDGRTNPIIPMGYYHNYKGEEYYNYHLGVKTIVLSEGIKIIGPWTFAEGCMYHEITYPDEVETDMGIVFGGPNETAITEVVLPSTITEIGYNAFTYCQKLTSITLPASLQKIGNNVFIGCYNLTEINFSPEIKHLELTGDNDGPGDIRKVFRGTSLENNLQLQKKLFDLTKSPAPQHTDTAPAHSASASIKCPSCGARLPASSKFCNECGTKIQTSCPQCGASLPPGSKFCNECGTKL